MEEVLAAELEKKLAGALLNITIPRKRKVSAGIAPEAIRKATEILLLRGARFVIIATVDVGLEVELLYHFDLDGTVVVLKVKLAKEIMDIDSIVNLTPAAEWAEKEAAELFGVSFRRHPAAGHLVLSDEWPEGNFPLTKPFKPKLADEVGSVAESLITVGATAPISSLVERKRAEAGLPPQPPASYSSKLKLKEVQELIKHTSFSERAGYDWERKRMRGVRK